MSDFPNIGARLKHALAVRGFTEADLVRLSGVRASTINSITLGARTNPRADTLARLAKALFIRLEWLATGAGEMDQDGVYRNQDGAVITLNDVSKHFAAKAKSGHMPISRDRLAEIVRDEITRVLGPSVGSADQAEIVAGVIRGYDDALKKP